MEDAFKLISELAHQTPSKIVLLVVDGLGGVPHPDTGKTELETASTPNLDALAVISNCGLSQPMGPAITPGSAPGHLSLFGYDPLRYRIGRGVLEAMGIDFPLEAGDIAIRGNYCIVDSGGLISDRRAGRLSTEENVKLCRLLDGMEFDGVKVAVAPVKEHRCVVVFRGRGLSSCVHDTDPQRLGVPPLEAEAQTAEAGFTAMVANRFLSAARSVLTGKPANMLLLRGFSAKPDLPSMLDVYRLKAAAIAAYPMYRGLARVVGMTLLPAGAALSSQLEALKNAFNEFDFFFIHVKGADAAGEDGDFPRKVAVIEEIDRALPEFLRLSPDVFLLAGDHSTPAVMAGHSWHSVPCLLHSGFCRHDGIQKFSENECRKGSLGIVPATALMPLAMAHALKLKKFGA
jgi:2,3-bisphosphoglycerate-independent phosphoglycerate mutase